MTEVTSPARSSLNAGREASQRLAEVFSPRKIDALLKEAKASGTPLDGVDGLLNQMTKAVLERALQAEMTDHLGYESGDPAGQGSGNSRNGKTIKTVSTTNGPVELDVPRDRNGSFQPRIVPKRARRIGSIEDMILSLYSRGMTTRDIEAHLREVYGVSASRELISNVTDVVTDEIELWRCRPLDEVYPILYVDGIRVKIKDNGMVSTKVAYLAIGVDLEGRKHALGWGDLRQRRIWDEVLAESRDRPAEPGCQRRPDRLLRRIDRTAGRDPFGLPRHRCADVCRARHQKRYAIRVGQGPQEGRCRDAGDLHRTHPRSRPDRPGRFRQAVRYPIPGRGRGVAPRLG